MTVLTSDCSAKISKIQVNLRKTNSSSFDRYRRIFGVSVFSGAQPQAACPKIQSGLRRTL